jgi:omega-amidase
MENNMVEKVDDLRVTLVQADLYWEKPEANRGMLEEMVSGLGGTTDLVVLPELFTTGFTMNVGGIAEPFAVHTGAWMRQLASRIGAVILGSVMVSEGGEYFNRLLVAEPGKATLSQYDKHHLFRMASEGDVYTAGSERLVFEYRGWKICPLICYDLRFPEWARNNFSQAGSAQYDVLIYVANWPAKRQIAWESLPSARAIENSAYSVAVNRVGVDGKGLLYSGGSGAWDYEGNRMVGMGNDVGLAKISLSMAPLVAHRESFPTWRDRSTGV